MPDDLTNLMLAYSQRGMREWSNAKVGLKKVAMQCLFNGIAEGPADVDWTVGGRHSDPKFIPMPRCGFKGFEWCFFLPKKVNGELRSLILFILVNCARRDCIAFRFEGSQRGRHGYAHLQLTSKLKNLGLTATPGVDGQSQCLPEWLPDSYPAFPIPARNWTEMFLAMVTAVHGHSGGVDVLIQEIFQEVQRPHDARKCMNVLEKMLVKLH